MFDCRHCSVHFEKKKEWRELGESIWVSVLEEEEVWVVCSIEETEGTFPPWWRRNSVLCKQTNY